MFSKTIANLIEGGLEGMKKNKEIIKKRGLLGQDVRKETGGLRHGDKQAPLHYQKEKK